MLKGPLARRNAISAAEATAARTSASVSASSATLRRAARRLPKPPPDMRCLVSSGGMDVQGRLAIVTGSGRGIGRSVALSLAGLGCNIVVNYFGDETAALATVAEIEKLGTRALAVQGDVSRDADCRRIVGEAQARFGRVDVLINNAATTVFVTHQELDVLTDEMWDRVFAVNVRGAFNMARAASPLLRASGRGAIVNVSSVASL